MISKNYKNNLIEQWNKALTNPDASASELLAEQESDKGQLKKTLGELERFNKELEQFIYVASHDLQEPLRMVLSYLKLLERRYQGKLGTDADEFIAFALDGAKRMQTLINDLLVYSRIRTWGKELEYTDSGNILDQVLSDLRLMIEDTGAVITYDTLPLLKADDVQLGLLLKNLVENAIKFQGEKPPKIHISANKKENEWVFSIRDNGIGIDLKYSDRVFLIFQRAHISDEYTGSGMGLAVCKRIIERHNGKIWFESELGNGTTFHFTIPIEEGD